MNNFILLGIGLAVAYLSTMLFIVQTKKDNSIGNFTWGGMVMLLTLYSFFAFSSYLPRQILATVLVMAWGLRLATHTYMRYKPGIDPRFIAWQQQKGGFWSALLFSFGWIFCANGFMGLVMSLPIVLINTSTAPGIAPLDIFALLCWLVGFYCEAVGDYQLYEFRKNPTNAGKVLSTGLWRYSRHPNYFGDIVMWWATFLIAVSVPYGLFAIISPMAVTITLVFVTGIPWLEKAMVSNQAYQEYKKHTSMLIPWLPK